MTERTLNQVLKLTHTLQDPHSEAHSLHNTSDEVEVPYHPKQEDPFRRNREDLGTSAFRSNPEDPFRRNQEVLETLEDRKPNWEDPFRRNREDLGTSAFPTKGVPYHPNAEDPFRRNRKERLALNTFQR